MFDVTLSFVLSETKHSVKVTYRAARRFSRSSAMVMRIPFWRGRETNACLPRPMTKMLDRRVAKVAPDAS